MSNGFILEKDIKSSNIIIINSCTVTSKADAKTRNIIRRSRREKPDALIIVCGCLVNTDLIELLKLNEVDIFLENKDKDKILAIINDYYSGKIISRPFIYKNINDGTFNLGSSKMTTHSRAFLKIQDGCDNSCAYCKIPLARGNSRSRNFNDIYREINLYIESGYEEVVFTGINLGSYKYDNIIFPELLNNLINKFYNIRFRISSIEPEYIDANFCEVFKNNKICPHLHIPLQNGSNKILNLMNRKYTTDEYFNKIEMIRNVKKNPFISTDLILGFPTETENDFNKTFDFIKKINFSFIHLFGYSPREKTKAYQLKPKVPERIRDERLKKIKVKADEMNLNYKTGYIDKILNVIIEQEKNGYYKGKSENYIDLIINTKKKLNTKKTYKVKFLRIENDNTNIGKIISPQPEPELH